MKYLLQWLLYNLLRFAFWFRYRVHVKGLDKMNPQTLQKPGGVLFLPNHPTVFIDPSLVSLSIWKRYQIRPMVIDYMYSQPGIESILRLVRAVPVPNFSAANNSIKRKRGEKVMQEVIDGLRHKDNFMIYPAGRLKSTGYEQIGGTSAVHRIIQEVPEVNIVLVRTTGLWGSSFSRAATGQTPFIFAMILRGIKKSLKNFLFFMPRRDVTIEFVPAGPSFPHQGSRKEINDYLERWYNAPFESLMPQKERTGEPLHLVSYSIWGQDMLKIQERQQEEKTEVDVSKVPEKIRDKVIEKIVQLNEVPKEQITSDASLSADLGLDSLDIAELAAFLQDEFAIEGVAVHELTTVKRVLGIASKQILLEEPSEEEGKDLKKWFAPQPHEKIQKGQGDTLIAAFLNQCDRHPKRPLCTDLRSGVLTYAQAKLRVILLAEYLRTQPGKYIGILLPASVVAYLLVFAIQLAGKVPVMVNWTVGPRHLDSVRELSGVQVVLSSWSFIDRLENVDFGSMDDNVVMLEDVRGKLRLKDKVKAFFRARRSALSLLQLFEVHRLRKEDPAVLLFTSGTESAPKGVPLSHENILANQEESLTQLSIYQDDTLLGILPPFHSFGFTVTGMLPFIWGVRVAYSPDPTNGKQVARAVKRWKATIQCGAPTFLKTMLKLAKPKQLDSLRLLVTGAEKAPEDLFTMVRDLGKGDILLEGYGITECSPVLTMNALEEKLPGVGRPLPGISMCIVDIESHRLLPEGEWGLILVRGKNVFSGYLNKGLASPFLTIQGRQWYNTGDLGHLDPVTGALILSGRLKRFVKIGGEMISLAALENALYDAAREKRWPLDAEGPSLAVLGREREGEKPVLILITRFPLSVEEANAALREQGISNLVRFSETHMADEIPVMGTGKVHYRKLEGKFFENRL